MCITWQWLLQARRILDAIAVERARAAVLVQVGVGFSEACLDLGVHQGISTAYCAFKGTLAASRR